MSYRGLSIKGVYPSIILPTKQMMVKTNNKVNSYLWPSLANHAKWSAVGSVFPITDEILYKISGYAGLNYKNSVIDIFNWIYTMYSGSQGVVNPVTKQIVSLTPFTFTTNNYYLETPLEKIKEIKVTAGGKSATISYVTLFKNAVRMSVFLTIYSRLLSAFCREPMFLYISSYLRSNSFPHAKGIAVDVSRIVPVSKVIRTRTGIDTSGFYRFTDLSDKIKVTDSDGNVITTGSKLFSDYYKYTILKDKSETSIRDYMLAHATVLPHLMTINQNTVENSSSVNMKTLLGQFFGKQVIAETHSPVGGSKSILLPKSNLTGYIWYDEDATRSKTPQYGLYSHRLDPVIYKKDLLDHQNHLHMEIKDHA